MDGEQSHQGGTPRSHSLVATKKVAYVVFNGQITGVLTEWFLNSFFAYIYFQLVRSSAKCQVKCFLGCSFKGYTNIDEAIATWDYAIIANDIFGECGSCSNTTFMVPPVMPSCHSVKSTPSHRTPSRTPSTPLHGISSKPSAQGSENHLAAIITALSDVVLNDIDLTSYYVVVRGEKPGVYSNRLVSVIFFLFFNILSNI